MCVLQVSVGDVIITSVGISRTVQREGCVLPDICRTGIDGLFLPCDTIPVCKFQRLVGQVIVADLRVSVCIQRKRRVFSDNTSVIDRRYLPYRSVPCDIFQIAVCFIVIVECHN